jgi:hypothetical protein
VEAVSDAKRFAPIAARIGNVLNKTADLPANVFQKKFKYFLFVTFDELFTGLFFNHLKKYLMNMDEKFFIFSSVDPDPESYFAFHFDFFGAIEFATSDSEDDYLFALNHYPDGSPADALAHHSDSLLIFSVDGRFAIYGSRDADIAICAFPDRMQMKAFKRTYGNDLLADASAAAEYAYDPFYSASDRADLVNEFCRNYGAK